MRLDSGPCIHRTLTRCVLFTFEHRHAYRRKRECSPSSDVDADYEDHRSNVTPSRTLQADIEKWKKSVPTRSQQVPVTADSKPPSSMALRRSASSLDGMTRTISKAALDNKVKTRSPAAQLE